MRWIVGGISVLLMLVLVVVGALALIPTEQVGALAAREFKRLTGRALVIEGAVKPSFWPTLGVRTGPVSVANAEWSDEGPMLSAESLSIDLDMASLLAGDIKIIGVEAIAPMILLERAKDGQENWVFGGGGAAGEVTEATPGVGRAYSLARGVISKGTFRFVDHATGQEVALDALDLEAAIPDFAGPVTLAGSAVINGQSVQVSAEAGVFSALTEGRVVPARATVVAGGSRISFDGRAGMQPMVAEGRLDADLPDLAAVAGMLGMAAPALPRGLGAEALSLKGALTLDAGGAVYLRGAEIGLDGNGLTGDLDLAPGEARPKLSARLTAGDLSLAAAIAGGGAGASAEVSGGASAPTSGGWSEADIDVSGLGALDAEVSLSAQSVDLGRLQLGKTRVLVTIDRARAVFDIREIAAYGGAVSGQFVANGRGGLSVGGDLVLAGLRMQPLLQDMAGYERLIGTADLRMKFLGVGNSLAAIMRSLKGEGSLSLGKGELRGLDVAGMLRTLDPGYVGEGQKTIFDGVTASYSVLEGVLRNSDLTLAAPLVTATGAGEVDLGRQSLNYRLRPTALAEADGTGGVMVPLLITGPWAKPKFALDLESIARERMEEEAAKLEARAREEAKRLEAEARAKAEAKLKEELGIEMAPGEDLEAAARRRAEEVLDAEAKKLLEGLLGGN